MISTIIEAHGRWTCTNCGREWSAMMSEDSIPKFCDCQHTNPHQLTEAEVRAEFLRHMWVIVDEWANSTREHSVRERIAGAVFSVLSTLDGCSTDIPGFVVAPCPHKDNKEYQKQRGQDWYPKTDESKIKYDIGGTLHERFHDFDPEK